MTSETYKPDYRPNTLDVERYGRLGIHMRPSGAGGRNGWRFACQLGGPPLYEMPPRARTMRWELLNPPDRKATSLSAPGGPAQICRARGLVGASGPRNRPFHQDPEP